MSTNNAHQSLRELSQRARAPRLRSRLDWSEQELVIPEGKYANQKFRVSRQPWTRHVLAHMGNWRRNLLTGPKQAGKTLLGFVDPIMYHLFEVGEKVGCGVPNLDMVSDKWNDDLLPAIEASRYRDLLPKSGRGSKGGTPIRIDFLNGASLRFFGAGGGDKQRAGFTTRVLVVTETDGFDEIGGTSRESTKLSQLEGRTLADPENALIYYECTVSTEDGFTWQNYHKGTASRMVCQCRHCEMWVTPGRDDLIGWQEADNEIQAGRSASFACPECGGLWSEDDRVSMNRKSILLHAGQEITDDGVVVGSPVETNLFSFHFNAFNNLFQPTWYLGEREWTAANSENHDEAEIAVLQEIWAQPVQDETEEVVDISVGIVRGSDSRFSGRVSGHAQGEIPENSGLLTAVIDLGKRILPWSVEVAVQGRNHVVDYGFFETRLPDVVGEAAAIKDAIGELTVELESRFDILGGFIDCGNWRELVFEWLRENKGRLWRPSHGLSNYAHPSKSDYTHASTAAKGRRLPKSNERFWHYAMDVDIEVVNFDPNAVKRAVHSRFLIPPLRQDGSYSSNCVTLFGEDPQLHTEFAKQVLAEKWVTEFKKNSPSRSALKSYFKKLSKNNHTLDLCAGHIVCRSHVNEVGQQKPRYKLSDLQKAKRR